MTKLMRFFIIICLSIFSFIEIAWSATENLDEMMARKARQRTAAWGSQYLENKSSYYYWQPETLNYADVQTGTEVWRMSNTPALENIYQPDIGVTPWSANGKRLAFQSARTTAAFNRREWRAWMIVNADGSQLRPVINGPSRTAAHSSYFHWSPQIPDVYYEFGRNYAYEGLKANVLYKATVSDTDVSIAPLLTFNTNHDTELALHKTISGDGKKLIAMTWGKNWWYPATIYPDASAKVDVPNGYACNRNLSSKWGDTPATYSSLHDQYYAGDGTWFYILPSGYHSWWRVKVLGSAADGGAVYSEPFNEEWPENTANYWGGTNDPYNSYYWSHFVPDRWGTHALFSNTQVTPIGPAVWDIQNHQWNVKTFGGGAAQHHDWHGFTDWTVSSYGLNSSNLYTTDKIFTQKYNDATSQKVVCYTHTLYNNSGTYAGASYEYSSLPRPAQSPDGTKVAFHSTFLNNKSGSYDTAVDVFWAVVYYPYPPIISGATQLSSNTIRLTWNSPKYTTRGWPNESTDSPPEPKEIKAYHVWVSPNLTNWNEMTTYGVLFGTNSYNVTQPSNSTWYYALTSEENSRLESHSLSNIWKITLGANGNIVSNSQQTAYPVNPGGVSSFWKTAPANPSNVSVTAQAASGQFLITWQEPQNTKIRYYNIYYSSIGMPPADQKYRIASVPAGTSKYLDWCAVPSSAAYYRVTSVDRQGNESSATDTKTISAPTGVSVRVLQ
jgi:hypothetical protein